MPAKACRLGARALALLFLVLVLPAAARAQSVACDPGEKEVVGLQFRGNHAFSSSELATRVNTTASSWARRHLHFFGTRRCLDNAELPRDVYRLRLVYRNAGYYNAKVDTLVAPAGRDAVKVSFLITEGQPILVDAAAITGLDSVPNRYDIVKGLDLGIGKPFDVIRFNAVADSIIDRLQNDGYPRADVLRNYDVRTDSLRAHVSLVAVPGPRERYGKLVVNALPVMPDKPLEIDSTVVRKLLGIRSGGLYREHDLIAAQRNLYQTGAYRHVEVAPFPDSLQPKGDSVVDLSVNLLEDYMRQLDTEVGWATLDCFRTRAVYTDKNFLSQAKRLQLTGQLSKIGYGTWKRNPNAPTRKSGALCYKDLEQDPFSQVLNYYAGATLTQPALFGTSAVPAFSIYTERRGEYLAYLRTTLIGGEASLTKNLGRRQTPLRVGYSLEYGGTEASGALLCAVFRRCDPESQKELTTTRPLAIASVALARIRTNSTIDPTEGSVIRTELRSSSRLIGSDPQLTFNKAVLDGSWYFSLGGTKVAAIRLRGGVIGGGTSSGTNGTRLPPPQERLYAGGANSVRGFQQNELGKLVYLATSVDTIRTASHPDTAYFQIHQGQVDRVIPVGGNSLFVMNLEYRVRDVFFPQLLQYTFFTDAGEVWNRDPGTPYLGFTNLKWTPGIGLRYFSPVGPIQVNVGYNPYRQPDGPVYYNAGYEPTTGIALPLYCVSPGTSVATEVARTTVTAPDGRTVTIWKPVDANASCPVNFSPPQRNNLLRKLTFTISIGTDF